MNKAPDYDEMALQWDHIKPEELREFLEGAKPQKIGVIDNGVIEVLLKYKDGSRALLWFGSDDPDELVSEAARIP